MQLIRTERDLRIDLFRGLALWWIFIDHIGANWLNRISLHNFAICDATEVFVLLAGYAAGLAYGRTMQRQGYFYAAADVLRRAWVLYIAHIFLFVVFTAQVAYSAQALDRADYLDEIHLSIVGNVPYKSLLEALTLGYQPSYLNILPLYIALLLLFVPALALLRRPPILAVLSFGLYAAARLLELDLPSWTGEGWYFNPLTWQLLFMSGAILSYAPGEPLPFRKSIDVLAIAVIAFGAVEKFFLVKHPELTANLPLPLTRAFISIDKEGLHPMRLISILSYAWLVSRWIPYAARWLRWPGVNAFVLCGQHSLPVFCGSIFLSFLGRLVFEQYGSFGWVNQVLVNVVGALALVMIAVVAAWYGAKGRLGKTVKIVGAAIAVVLLSVPPPARAAELPPVVAPIAAPVIRQSQRGDKAAPADPADRTACPVAELRPEDGDALNNVTAGLKSGHLSILAIGSGALSSQPNGKGTSFYEALVRHFTASRPGVAIDIVVRGSRGMAAKTMVERLPEELAHYHPQLVIWQTGTADATRGVPPDDFDSALLQGVALIQAANADVVVIDPPYSRFLDATADLSDYEPAFRDVAALPGIILFRRNDIMRDWALSGALDLEADPTNRKALRAKLHDCLSQVLLRQIMQDSTMGDDKESLAAPAPPHAP